MDWLQKHIEVTALWIGIISGLLTIISFGVGVANWLTQTQIPAWGFGVGYGLFAVTAIAWIVYLYSQRRKLQETVSMELGHRIKGYENIHYVLSESHRYLYWYRTKNSHQGTEVVKEKLYHICVEAMDYITESLLLFTKYKCASCIKTFVYSQGEPNMVITFCRDRVSKDIRGSKDGKERYRVDLNTASYTVLNVGEPYFFSNNLLKETNYHNERQDFAKYYKSTVVLPIRGFPVSDEAFEGQSIKGQTVGLLCVDSKETNVFDERETVAFLSCLADALYWPLAEFQKVMEENPRQKGGEIA